MAQSDRDVIWTPGTPHPKHPVIAAEEEGTWIPAPGYTWATEPPQIDQVAWKPGLKHPQKNLIAGDKDGDWKPAPGYNWTENNGKAKKSNAAAATAQ